MDRTIKTIQRERPKSDKSTINENHINIDINMADKEKEHIKEVVQEILPVLVQPIEDIEEEPQDEEMDKLVQELEDTIKEFMTFRQALLERKIDVPNELLEIPDIDIKEKSDIENLIKILKDRIVEFKFLLNKAQTPPPITQPIKSQPTLSSIPQRLRSRMDIAQPARTRIRPTQYGDANYEEARKDFRETQTFLLNRDLNNTTDLTLIERALLRLNRNKNFINSVLIEPQLTAKERNLLRDLLKQVEVNINKIQNRKLTLQGKPPQPEQPQPEQPKPEQPQPEQPQTDPPKDAPQDVGDEEDDAVIPETQPPPPQTRRPIEGDFAEEDEIAPEENLTQIKAPQKNRGKYRNNLPLYISDLESYIKRNEQILSRPTLKNLNNALKVAKQELKELQEQDMDAPEDEVRDNLDISVDNRILQIRGYLNNIQSTGRSTIAVAKLRNDLDKYIDDLIADRNDAAIEVLQNYIKDKTILDLSNGNWGTATAFQNFISELKPSDSRVDNNTIFELRPLNMDDIRQNNPNARQAYGLYKNGNRILTNRSGLSEAEKEFRSRFTQDGDIYNSSDINPPSEVDEFTETEQPEPEIQPPQPETQVEDFTERNNELAEYRNRLYYTGREGQQTIVDNLNTQIGDSMDSNNLIILDRTDGNIPATLAYYRLPANRPTEENIDTAELQQVPRSEIPSGGNDAFLLYINGELQRDENGQQKLYNEYGDPYSADDIRGDTVSITFPFRPASRTDLDTSDKRITPRQIIENRRQAISVWALPPENEDDRQTLLNVIDMVMEKGGDDNDIYIPILSNAGYDVGATFAYINEHNNGRVPALEDSETKIELVESTRHPGLYFLKVDNQVYDMEGDMIFLPTGVGERIKMQGMKIHGTDSVIPSGFRGGDSYTIGRISDIGAGGLDAGRNPILYSIERTAAFAPQLLDIYEKIKEGN